MDRTLFLKILLFGSAVLVAMVVYFLTSRLSVEKSSGKRVREMIDTSKDSLFDLGGSKISGRLKGGIFTSWERSLFWAQLDDGFNGWSVGGMAVRGLFFAIVFAVVIIFLGMPSYSFFVVPFALFVPYILVNGKASEVMKKVKRLLPETATVIAAEMDAGATAGQAVERTGELPGPLGRVLSMAVSKARQSERAMFSRGANPGVLMEELNKHGMPELSRFVMQIDRVAAKGVDAPRIMVEIAKGLAREYKSEVQAVSSNMDTELLFPMSIFFFLPFIVSLLVPLVVSFMGLF
jgi:tight adherence protein C